MKQIHWQEAEKLSKECADKAMGFGPSSGSVTLKAEDIHRVAANAAYIALQKIGALDADRKRMSRQMSCQTLEK